MNLISSLFGSKSTYPAEYKKFKKAMAENPRDHGLKAQFIKFCLLNRFTKHETMENHIKESLGLFETIEHGEDFDLQCHYLVGKYYQEVKDSRKAYQIYQNAIKHFNQYVGKNPDLKAENVELAYSIALNLMGLQLNAADPDLQTCFKLIRKSYPLHVKRIEYENEMARPAPDKTRVKQLIEEIRKLKAAEEKEALEAEKEKGPLVVAAEKTVDTPAPKPVERDDIFSKLFRVPSLLPDELTQLKSGDQKPTKETEEKDKKDVFKLSPPTESASNFSSYMVFQNNDWEGPFTLAQLRSKGSLDPATWVCRVGSQLVSQAYEVPDLHSLIQKKK
jgi:tetratricopeptide (TPR) repeat protein